MTYQKKRPLRLAHISDMHCYRLTLSLTQFLSKRWLGNINVLVNRRMTFHKDPNSNLVDLFEAEKIDHVIVSGDVSTTSLSEEFAVAAEFMEELGELRPYYKKRPYFIRVIKKLKKILDNVKKVEKKYGTKK